MCVKTHTHVHTVASVDTELETLPAVCSEMWRAAGEEGLVQRCRCTLWAGGCGKVEGCTFIISQHREWSAGCSVTTSSPLLSLSTPLQGFKPPFVSLTNNSFDILLYTDENVDFLFLCGLLTLSHLLFYCGSFKGSKGRWSLFKNRI